MALFIGLDIGTSRIKGVLISAEGISLARAEAEVPLVYPAPGRIEVSPVLHYETVCRVIRELAANASGKKDIKGVCLSGATGNALLLDKNMRPLTNSISWMDKRAGNDYCTLLSNLDPRNIYETVGWPWGNGFPLTQFAWHKKHCPDIYKSAAYYVMQMTYVYYRLTNRLGIEPSTATTFYLQDQINQCYYTPLLKALDLDEDSLPPILPSGSVLGTVTGNAALKTGLSASTQIVLGTFDHPSAARGTGVLQPGDLLLSCGTSWVGFYPAKDRSPGLANNLLIDPFLSPQGPWAFLFSLSKAGNIVDNAVYLIVRDVESFDRLSANAPEGAGGLFINPMTDLENPKEAVSRLIHLHQKPEILRALMEGVCFEIKRKIDMLSNAAISANRIVMAGGPCQSPIWPVILSNVLGIEIRIINGNSAGATGAALLAGTGSGLFKDAKEGFDNLKIDEKTIIPDAYTINQYEELYHDYINRNKASAVTGR